MANPLPLPPVDPPALWPLAHPMLLVEVQEGAKPAEELGVHPLPLRLPLEELVVHVVVPVQHLQVLGKLGRAFEVVHMEEGVGWGHCSIIFRTWSHHDGQDVAAKTIGKELLSDVILAVGVLKGQVELVVVLQHLQAVTVLLLAGEVPTLPIDVHLVNISISVYVESYLVTWIYLASLFA